MKSQLSIGLLVGVIACVLGCNQSTTVSGQVTLNGEPVQKGSISFRPIDGLGKSCGSMIEDGRYFVDDASPGRRVAVVTAVDTEKLARTREDFLKPRRQAEMVDIISPSDEGNSQSVVISKGAQTLDFAIQK